MNDKPAVAYLGLGSNMGDKSANVDRAIAALCMGPCVRLVSRSRYYRSAPWGVTDQDWFVNACIGIETGLDVHALLAHCQAVENGLGRVRSLRWGPRTIDIDILDYDGQRCDTPELALPHPRLAERAFVLVPLAEIAPWLRIHGDTVEELARGADRTGLEVLEM